MIINILNNSLDKNNNEYNPYAGLIQTIVVPKFKDKHSKWFRQLQAVIYGKEINHVEKTI